MTKTINGIEYIVYEAGMSLNDPEKSFYFEDDLDYDGDEENLQALVKSKLDCSRPSRQTIHRLMEERECLVFLWGATI